MATATIAKSVFRENLNVIVGYGEVPATEYEGIQGWGLPGGIITFSEAEAIKAATKLDREIRATMTNPNQLLSVC